MNSTSTLTETARDVKHVALVEDRLLDDPAPENLRSKFSQGGFVLWTSFPHLTRVAMNEREFTNTGKVRCVLGLRSASHVGTHASWNVDEPPRARLALRVESPG